MLQWLPTSLKLLSLQSNIKIIAYISGNAAYAHINAILHLKNQSIHPLRDWGGLSVFICDDSPTGTSDEVLNPFLNNFGLSTTPVTFPFITTIIFTLIISFWFMFWEKVGCLSRWRSVMPSFQLQNLAATNTIARTEVGMHFKPKYSWKDSKRNSLFFYEKLIQTKTNKTQIY